MNEATQKTLLIAAIVGVGAYLLLLRKGAPLSNLVSPRATVPVRSATGTTKNANVDTATMALKTFGALFSGIGSLIGQAPSDSSDPAAIASQTGQAVHAPEGTYFPNGSFSPAANPVSSSNVFRPSIPAVDVSAPNPSMAFLTTGLFGETQAVPAPVDTSNLGYGPTPDLAALAPPVTMAEPDFFTYSSGF